MGVRLPSERAFMAHPALRFGKQHNFHGKQDSMGSGLFSGSQFLRFLGLLFRRLEVHG